MSGTSRGRKSREVHGGQIVEHGSEAALFHLCVERGEVGEVALVLRQNVQHEVAPLVVRCGHHPVVVRRQQEVEHVRGHDRGAVFRFDKQRAFGDDAFEDAFVLLVAGIEGFVGEHEDHIAKVSGEVAGQVLGVDDMQAVLAAEPQEPFAEHAFADAFVAAHDDGDFGGLVRVLDHVREPADHVATNVAAAGADHIMDVGGHQ